MSYERIAATLTKHGVKVSSSRMGVFCRRTLIEAGNLRERRRIEKEVSQGPAATAPSFRGLSAVATPGSAPVPPGRRGPRETTIEPRP
jgi:hypothetical protein